MNPITYQPIGILNSSQINPYQASKQPDELSETAIITLETGYNFEQALQDLNGCSHVWIIYDFHHNKNWKPLTQPPRSEKKIGVFATRAPYRPNSIGMSAVSLISINGLKITLGPNDILDGTPILDIKPYHPEYDIIHDAEIKWLKDHVSEKFEIKLSPLVVEKIEYLESASSFHHQVKQLKSFIYRQLQFDPCNKQKKRVEEINSTWVLSYRTWKIDFILSENNVAVINIRSGYSDDELKIDEDPYSDKNLHRDFIKQFGN